MRSRSMRNSFGKSSTSPSTDSDGLTLLAWLRKQRIALLGLCTLILAIAGTALYVYELDKQINKRAGPQEGAYWSAVQYQLAFIRAREGLAILELGGDISDAEVRRRLEVLESRKALMTTPSLMTEQMRRVPGFLEAASVIEAFHGRIDELAMTIQSTREHAPQLVKQFDEVYTDVLILANDSRSSDLSDREIATAGMRQLKEDFLKAVGGLILLGTACFISLLVSRERQLQVLLAREAAMREQRQSVEARTRFLGLVSHELRTPLQIIMSAVDVLEHQRGGMHDSETTKKIRRSANTLSALLRDILTLARGQSGSMDLRPEVFELGALVSVVVEDARPYAASKRLSLTLKVTDESVFVVADSARIAQLLNNLLSNAVKYTPEGGVHVDLLPFKRAEKDARIRVRISDTGPGLPESARALVMTGKEVAMTDRDQRRGLGLEVVRALVLQLGADLEIIDAPHGGTIFELSIPAALAEESPPDLAALSTRLLVVDDREDLLSGFASVCADMEIPCDTAASGAIALNLLAAHRYRLLLIDLDMPGMTGTEMARVLRRSGAHHGARLVGMSAGSGTGEALPVFDEVLEKPITRERLGKLMGTKPTALKRS